MTERSEDARREPPASDIARRRQERRQAAGGRRSDVRWRQILAGAAAVFTRLGYAGSTLEDVAGEVGINRATLYYYVGTKEELLVALLSEPLRAVLRRLEEVTSRSGPARERLAAALRAYVAMMTQHPELSIFLRENVHALMSGPEAEDIHAYADRYGRVLAQVIADGAGSGEFRSDIEPAVAVLGILGMLNWMPRWYRPGGSVSLEECGEMFTMMSLAALAPVGPAESVEAGPGTQPT